MLYSPPGQVEQFQVFIDQRIKLSQVWGLASKYSEKSVSNVSEANQERAFRRSVKTRTVFEEHQLVIMNATVRVELVILAPNVK